MQEPNVIVMDTRLPYAFAGSHIPEFVEHVAWRNQRLPRLATRHQSIHRFCT